MKTHEFPGCCGGVVFAEFGHCPSHAMHGTPELDAINKWLDTNEDFQRKTRKKSFVAVTLTRAQERVLGMLFKRRGYKRSEGGLNPCYINAKLGVFILPLQTDNSNVTEHSLTATFQENIELE